MAITLNFEPRVVTEHILAFLGLRTGIYSLVGSYPIKRSVPSLGKPPGLPCPATGSINQGALFLDHREYEVFVLERAPALAQNCLRTAVLRKGDRRMAQVRKPNRITLALRAPDKNHGEVTRIVEHAQLAVLPTRPEAQDIVPIAQAEEMDAIAAHHAFRARQEVDPEPLRIVRPAQKCLAPPIGLVPGRNWRNPERAVPFSMIAGDFQRQPVLQLVERHRRLAHGIVVATVLDAAEGRSRQQVDRPHHCADQPLDVTAVMWCPNRTVL